MITMAKQQISQVLGDAAVPGFQLVSKGDGRGWMPCRISPLLALLVIALLLLTPPLLAAERFILLQSTTSVLHAGLYDHLLPRFQAATGIEVRVVAVGSGQAIRNARNCDGDILIVHEPQAEEQFVADGAGLWRRNLMQNDFVLIGPADDPAGLNTAASVSDAMRRIYEHGAVFVSRGDDSGTHHAEKRLWQQAGLDPLPASGKWYLEAGTGMGATLNIAVQRGGYTLSDRATWLAFRAAANHQIVFAGDALLFNQYGIIPVSPKHCPAVRHADALRFADWMLGAEGQAAIAALRPADGRGDTMLFIPNAMP